MNERPQLDKNLDSKTFRDFYYLKEELVEFCRKNGLPVSGGKMEIAERIAYFLDTGKIQKSSRTTRKAAFVSNIKRETIIEDDFVCSETHRAFFKEQIGAGFSFNVGFQKWLKSNAGKTYADAVEAYYELLEKNKKRKTAIGRQFEYNAYIRDFFEDNQERNLKEAVICWKYKKSLRGHNRYEPSDLTALG